MRRETVILLLAGLVLALSFKPLVAHHSGSMWDTEHRITLKGPVTEVSFSNPHVQIHFEAKGENGNSAQWTAVSASPARLYRRGWNSKTLRQGDLITVTGIPARDGSKIVNVRELVGPRGQTLLEGAD